MTLRKLLTPTLGLILTACNQDPLPPKNNPEVPFTEILWTIPKKQDSEPRIYEPGVYTFKNFAGRVDISIRVLFSPELDQQIEEWNEDMRGKGYPLFPAREIEKVIQVNDRYLLTVKNKWEDENSSPTIRVPGYLLEDTLKFENGRLKVNIEPLDNEGMHLSRHLLKMVGYEGNISFN